MAACHSAASCSAFGSFVMYVPGVFEGDQLATIGQRDRIIERTSPFLLVSASTLKPLGIRGGE
jgi:hypothetical protein